ncbi:polyprenyl synthetase family protein [Bacteriovorax sp. Seq25_V]|uniref:polyprenyl synthetase family protein n=1 Tax=Bacteriovorax sp. Seq25_V TaxID=1201288 RepID=UPI00038A35A1|nr:polyprenyl synthetase family protein [Bacteriovorax sp. Seq25_V]EQC46257.1 geranyltranstransferase domain protein [Bacteriovorax sp. Seq25_V]
MPTEQLNKNLKQHINKEIYDNFFSDPYIYSLFPAGKLFRPLMVWSVSNDFFGEFNNNSALIASFTEVHHTYTLIHDDMPCMDDDDMRRGRPSTHKQFGQWQALLSGDGLLNASYGILSRIQGHNLGAVLRYASWALGPKGLILGQALDLSGVMTESFNDLVLTHKLKTARLIQVCLVAPILAQEGFKDTKKLKDLHRLGYHMGVAFQILDDLCELTDEVLSEHENEVNPWPRFTKQCAEELNQSLIGIEKFFNKYESKNLRKTYASYLEKIKTQINGSENIIEGHINTDLRPIMLTLDRLCS